jgi:NADH:ubiquinone oxidoreductase subunit F (NADH-binding)
MGMSLIDTRCASLDDYRAVGGLRGLEAAVTLPPEGVIGMVGESGLRGRGGGGFPTGEKWRAIRDVGTGDRYVVCNAAEGEPATFKDRHLLRTNPYQVLEGILIAAYAIGAKGAYIGPKEAFTPESHALVCAQRRRCTTRAWSIQSRSRWSTGRISTSSGKRQVCSRSSRDVCRCPGRGDPTCKDSLRAA